MLCLQINLLYCILNFWVLPPRFVLKQTLIGCLWRCPGIFKVLYVIRSVMRRSYSYGQRFCDLRRSSSSLTSSPRADFVAPLGIRHSVFIFFQSERKRPIFPYSKWVRIKMSKIMLNVLLSDLSKVRFNVTST